MGRKKTSFYKPSVQIETGNNRYDNQSGRIKAINSWDDIEHDSEEEFHEEREKISIGDNHDQRQEYESSEEEVFALQTGESFSEDGDKSQEENQENDLMSSDDKEFDEFYSQTWGNHKKAYYDADELSDFDEAKEEEEEALRLQRKNISKMSEEDFFDDDDNWLGNESVSTMDLGKENEKKLMGRLNQEVQKISIEKDSGEIQPKNQDHYSNLSRTEIIEILQEDSPELMELLNEFKEKISILKDTLTPVLEKAKERSIKDEPAMKFLSIKYYTLLNYLTNISFYFFLKSSGSLNLRTHPVIDALVDLKIALNKLETLESKMGNIFREFNDRIKTDEHIDQRDDADKGIIIDEIINDLASQKQIGSEDREAKTKKSDEKNVSKKCQKKLDKKKRKSKKIKSQHLGEESKSHIDNLLNLADTLIEPEFESFKNMKKNKRTREDLDLGDLDVLDDVDADDKAQNRKSLRHYVAKIDQNLLKREKAIRLGGDADIPYKDKDRSTIKPINNPNNGDDLDDLDWNEDDEKTANDIETGGEEEYYLTTRKIKKAQKEQKIFEYETNNKNNEIIYEEEILPDGSKRQVNYEILKNKGLTPHRKKEQRNPRVKHRNKYEKAKKRIKSTKRIVDQQRGPYGGEGTGIKTKLSRSIKFSD